MIVQYTIIHPRPPLVNRLLVFGGFFLRFFCEFPSFLDFWLRIVIYSQAPAVFRRFETPGWVGRFVIWKYPFFFPHGCLANRKY